MTLIIFIISGIITINLPSVQSIRASTFHVNDKNMTNGRDEKKHSLKAGRQVNHAVSPLPFFQQGNGIYRANFF